MTIVPSDQLGVNQRRNQQTMKALQEAAAAGQRLSANIQECAEVLTDTVTLSFTYPKATGMPDGSPKKFDLSLIGGRSGNILEAIGKMIEAIKDYFEEPNGTPFIDDPSQGGATGGGSAVPEEEERNV